MTNSLSAKSIRLLLLLFAFYLLPTFLVKGGNTFYKNRIKYEILEDCPNNLKVIDYSGLDPEEISLPDSIEYQSKYYTVTEIASTAFQQSNITGITLPKTISVIGSNAFLNCMLEYVVVVSDNPYFSSVDGALFNKDRTTLIFYPTYKKEIFYAVPATVEDISEFAFFDNYYLQQINLPASLRNLGHSAFEHTRLISIDIPEGVTSLNEGTFRFCTSLQSVKLPESLVSIGDDCFRNCLSLNLLSLPQNLESIGEFVFNDCKNLRQLNIPSALSNITPTSFIGMDSLVEFIVDPNNLYFSATGGNLYSRNKTHLIAYCGGLSDSEPTIPSGTTHIDDYAFYQNKHIENVHLPESLEYIGKHAFYGSNLISLLIPDGVKSLGESCFRFNHRLKSIHLPTSLDNIADYLLDSSALTSIELPEQVKKIGRYAFANTTRLESFTVPDQLTLIADGAFYSSSISNFIVGKTTESLGNEVFRDCANLESITFGRSLTSIGDNCFENCKKLKQILPGQHVKAIGSDSFRGCTNIQLAILSPALESIGNFAFYDCSHIKHLAILSDLPPTLGQTAFYFSGTVNKPQLYVPARSKDLYDAKSYPWALFKGINGIDYQYLENGDNEISMALNDVPLLLIPLNTSVPASERTVGWQSTDTRVATVDNELGLVSAKAVGETTVWFRSTIDSTIDESEVRCKISITETGIGAIANDSDLYPTAVEEIYDLNGTYLGHTTEGLAPGLYICRHGNTTRKVSVR